MPPNGGRSPHLDHQVSVAVGPAGPLAPPAPCPALPRRSPRQIETRKSFEAELIARIVEHSTWAALDVPHRRAAGASRLAADHHQDRQRHG
jgi:hypothetical protein